MSALQLLLYLVAGAVGIVGIGLALLTVVVVALIAFDEYRNQTGRWTKR